MIIIRYLYRSMSLDARELYELAEWEAYVRDQTKAVGSKKPPPKNVKTAFGESFDNLAEDYQKLDHMKCQLSNVKGYLE